MPIKSAFASFIKLKYFYFCEKLTKFINLHKIYQPQTKGGIMPEINNSAETTYVFEGSGQTLLIFNTDGPMYPILKCIPAFRVQK